MLLDKLRQRRAWLVSSKIALLTCRITKQFLVVTFLLSAWDGYALAQPNPFNLLPSWPFAHTGAKIHKATIRKWEGNYCGGKKSTFHAFTDKASVSVSNSGSDRAVGADQVDSIDDDPDAFCHDDDQNLFNGLLCAAGDNRGCDAVAAAQDSDGHWARSPHRKWVEQVRCPVYLPLKKTRLYHDRCARGFSPDANLGTLLYVVAKHKVAEYQNWVTWLDNEATNSQLCDLDKNGQVLANCHRQYWVRFCLHDRGYWMPGDTPLQKLPIVNKYGGSCSLRPWDALDMSLVNGALGAKTSHNWDAFDLTSRTFLQTANVLTGGITDAVAPTWLVKLSLAEGSNYPRHLDATRILLRMLILNPSLKTSNLPPDLPSPKDVINMAPSLGNVGVSDGSDPLSIHLAAVYISGLAPWNPYYRLLAEGPTNGVRNSIIEHCPPEHGDAENSDWNWEQANWSQDMLGYSMGWDCVFVAKLYNKMRVKQDLGKELLKLFLQYSNTVTIAKASAAKIFDDANKANALADGALKLANDALTNLNDLISKRNAAQQAVLSLPQQINSAQGRLASIAPCPPLDFTHSCDKVKNAIKSQINHLNGALAAENSALTTLNAQIGQLNSVAIQASYNAKKLDSTLRQAALKQAQVRVSDVIKVQSSIRSSLCIWKDDGDCQASIAQ
jgi:hypothetical protein